MNLKTFCESVLWLKMSVFYFRRHEAFSLLSTSTHVDRWRREEEEGEEGDLNRFLSCQGAKHLRGVAAAAAAAAAAAKASLEKEVGRRSKQVTFSLSFFS